MSAASLISVMIPVWNGAGFLREAVASIRAQQYAPLEILVLDDGSTDETARVAAQLQNEIRYCAFPHRGLAATRNAGLKLARGELFAFLDVDDLWSSNKLALQTALLRDNPATLIVNGQTQLMRLVGTDGEIKRFENWGAPTLAFSFCSALFRRHVFDQVGAFDQAHEATLDLDWFTRARELAIPMRIHSEVVLYYRRHEKNMTNDQERGKRDLLQMLKGSLARRSQQGQEGVSLSPLNYGEG